MYVPTITAIVVLRHYLGQRATPANILVGIASLAVIGTLFIAAQFYGTLAVPQQAFADHLQSRMADPARTDLLSFAFIWYQPLAKEIADTWARLPHNILGVPVFAFLIWLHTPLWRYFAGLVRALASDTHRRIVIAALAIVTSGYLIMFAIVFDYSRWVSNWAVCLFLILHAVKALPVSRETPLIPSDDTKTTIFGTIVTLIPRVGIVRPF
jgi:multisubunit Na+/H+ antiporter MnhE subunit